MSKFGVNPILGAVDQVSFTVTDGNVARVGLFLIQSFLLYYVNHEAKFALEKRGGLFQKKVTLSLMFRQG